MPIYACTKCMSSLAKTVFSFPFAFGKKTNYAFNINNVPDYNICLQQMLHFAFIQVKIAVIHGKKTYSPGICICHLINANINIFQLIMVK